MKIKTPKSPEDTTAHLGAKVSVTDEVTKELLHEEETTQRVKVNNGGGAMKIRYVESIKLSRNFQSIGLEVGFVEYPADPNRPASEVFEEAAALVEEEIAKKVAELDVLLAKLGAKKKLRTFAGVGAHFSFSLCIIFLLINRKKAREVRT
jgi:hypothetical protein